jgi:sugar-specific transcriptional regulator TrmB
MLQALTFSGREARAFAVLVDGRITAGTGVDMFTW